MFLLNEDLARAQISRRRRQAQERGLGRQLELVHRAAKLSRRAEQAGRQARLRLARCL